jgi:hypothetical protein
MLDDLEERIRRLELSLRSGDDTDWPDVRRQPEPEPLLWPDRPGGEPPVPGSGDAG